MPSNLYGYIRVSAKDQNIARQVIALEEFGVRQERIFTDKQSGKDFLRPHYQGLIDVIAPGDVVVVKAIDRLGRNYEEIIEQWRLLTKEKQVDVVVLDMPLLDTRSKPTGLTGTFVSDLVLQILSYVAQTERENIRQRQREGIDAALSRGVQFGRPRIELGEDFPMLKEQWLSKTISAEEAAAKLKISYKTFLRRVKEASATL